jgi:hypothetical protein
MNSRRSIAPVLAAIALVAAGMFVSVGAQPAYADVFVPVTISGSVFEDRNGDAVFDPFNELKLDDWMVGLFDGNTVVGWVATTGGDFTFTGVGPGTFSVVVDPPAAWVPTVEYGPNPVTTSSGVDVGGIEFGYFLPGILSGYVLEDRTGDGFSADDTPLAAPVTIDLFTEGQVSPVATTATIYGGYYSFASLGWGIYTVQERVPAGYVLTAQTGATTYGYSRFQSTGNDFDNFPTFHVAMLAVQPVEGSQYMGAVARLTPGESSSVASDFTATIDWGDGVVAAGGVTSDPNGGFLVNGAHAYAEEGMYTLAVSVTKAGGTVATASEFVTVPDAALHAGGQASPVSRSATFSGVVAMFTDGDPNGVVADYSARIDWGDGTSSTGAVAAGSPGFTITGSHSFSQGTFTITTTVSDHGGASASATSSITIDWTPPTTTTSLTSNVLTLAAVDNLTGVQATYYTVNGGAAQRYTAPVTLKTSKFTIQYWSVDGAGNTESAHSIQVKVNHGL